MDAPDSTSTPAVRAHVSHALVSHAVIATYVADAVEQVAGVSLAAPRAVRVTGSEGPIDLELHVALAAGVGAPAACHALDGAVRRFLHSMMALETGRISVVVEEAAGVAG
jgi:uncharacterized alkaline shock family protein YloU